MNQSRWERLSAIYHATREQPPEARPAFLDEACRGDPELRAEIESLLRHDLPTGQAFNVTGAEPQPAPAVAPGTQIGIYRIERPLGAGGMGEVHLATDTHLNRPVALKFVSVAANQETRRRFQQETRAASSLNHPHILTVHDSGQFAGRDYLVTEYVDGGTLKAWRGAAPRTWRQTVELLIGVADALATAHDAGILHRDVKPANILVAQNGYAKLADFGLAKLAATRDHETRSEPRTGTGVVVGTIDYMSPEQLSGGAIDRRSDIFSFGIVLYEMLAGRRPFTGQTTVHVVEGILHEAPPPLGVDIPTPLRDIVAKALEKDPDDRYQSMRELVVDLRRAVRQTTETPVIAATRGRRRPWALAAALVLMLAVTGAAVAWWRSDRMSGGLARPPIQSIALVSMGNASNDADEEVINDGILDEISIRLANVHDVKVISPMSTRGYKRTTKRPQEIGRELGADAILQVSMQRAAGRVGVRAFLIDAPTNTQLWADSFDHNVDDVFRMQADVAQAIVRELGVRVLPGEAERLADIPRISSDAHMLYLHGRHQLSRGVPEGTDKAIEYFNRAIALEKNYALAYAGLSWAWQSKLGFVASPENDAILKRALEAANKAVDLDGDLAEAHAALGGVKFEHWDWAGSQTAYDKALELNPASIDCGCYAYVLSALGRLDRAFDVSKRVLDRNPESVDAHMEHGFVLLMMKRYREAEPHFLLARELAPENLLPKAHLTTIYTMEGDWEKALMAARQTGFSAILGRVYALKGDRVEAEKILRQTPRTDLLGIAAIELALGNTDRGLNALRQAVEQRNSLTRWIKVEPYYDKVRNDPRFQAIVALLKFPE